MTQSTFEEQLAAELQKFGCEYHITVADILREFSELDLKEQAALLDPEDLALVIMDSINKAGIMELVHTALRNAVMDSSSAERAAWHAAMSADDATLLAEMRRNGRDQEALHG